MNIIRKQLDKIREPFEEGGKFEQYQPAINALDTFLFVPKYTTKKGAHIRDAVDLKRTMITVIIALIPALLFGMWNAGYQHYVELGQEPGILEAFMHGAYKIVPMIVVSYGVGLAIEFFFAVKRGHEVNEGYLVTGLLIPMIMPIDIPLWMVALSVIFSVLIAKEAFGGTGMNLLNPALTARAFAFFAYPTYMSGNKVWVSEASNVDTISGETILGALAGGKEVAYNTASMFSGVIPGSISETSTLLILLGAGVLIFTKVGSWRIILSGFAGAAAMGLIFNALPSLGVEGNALTNFPWYQHLIVGGLAFGVVFMATDPVSGSQTNKGKWIYGFLIGFLGVMIRIFNPAYPEGIMLAILLMNVFAPTIDHYVVGGNIKRRKKRLKTQPAKAA
ncbi:MAG: NADH:ubiquinone reductase (Na(+)-transporting) subunit B [Psychroflexus sp.]|jgi:Na+-transporting NADH:ubiquinone oxidoreductase subunit B|nr:NADH:ubiquinone reductase (Na(+)-transporting) subunit B [Psychroflexus sp.]MDR9449238.1 NADH:ubiquinone reductase (Na(+)-transporting) subunit B [Psychroflexus sp.]